jgi:heat shock protein HslJ
MKKYLIIFISLFFLTSNAQINFKGITWVLTKIEDKRNESSLIIDHTYSILRFEDSTYVGYGCNAFSGKYKITGNKINFIGGMLNTDQGCTDPEDYKAEDYVMQNFLQLEFMQSGDSLILKKSDRIIFTYVKRKEKDNEKGKGKGK